MLSTYFWIKLVSFSATLPPSSSINVFWLVAIEGKYSCLLFFFHFQDLTTAPQSSFFHHIYLVSFFYQFCLFLSLSTTFNIHMKNIFKQYIEISCVLRDAKRTLHAKLWTIAYKVALVPTRWRILSRGASSFVNICDIILLFVCIRLYPQVSTCLEVVWIHLLSSKFPPSEDFRAMDWLIPLGCDHVSSERESNLTYIRKYCDKNQKMEIWFILF